MTLGNEMFRGGYDEQDLLNIIPGSYFSIENLVELNIR